MSLIKVTIVLLIVVGILMFVLGSVGIAVTSPDGPHGLITDSKPERGSAAFWVHTTGFTSVATSGLLLAVGLSQLIIELVNRNHNGTYDNNYSAHGLRSDDNGYG